MRVALYFGPETPMGFEKIGFPPCPVKVWLIDFRLGEPQSLNT
jgi:hypothetical protein